MFRIFALPLATLALTACAVPKFPEDSGTADLVPADSITCENQDKVFCSPQGCDEICHKKNGDVPSTGSHCDDPVVVNGKRIDNCAPGNVCLEPAPNTSIGHYCFALCKDKAGCTSGVACGERSLTGNTSIRVCDPLYKNCEGSCCDPSVVGNNGCDLDRPCYLVPPLENINPNTSWTVCEYASGGANKDDKCNVSRDCYEGLTCVGGTCHQVCDPSKEEACGGNRQQCQPYPERWGYCR